MLPSPNTGERNFVQSHPKVVLAGKVGVALTTAALAAVAITAFLHIGTFAQHAQLAQYVGIGTAAGGGVLAIGLVSFIIYSCKRQPAAEEPQPVAEEPQPAKKEESLKVIQESAVCRLAGLLLLAKIATEKNKEQKEEYEGKLTKYFSIDNPLPCGEHHFKIGSDQISLYVSFSENLPADVQERMWRLFPFVLNLLLDLAVSGRINTDEFTAKKDSYIALFVLTAWQQAALCTDEATHENCGHRNALVVQVRDKSFLFWGNNHLKNVSEKQEQFLQAYDDIANSRPHGSISNLEW